MYCSLIERAHDLRRVVKTRKLLRSVLIGLLALNALFIAIHLVAVGVSFTGSTVGWVEDRAFLLNRDGGYPEVFNYGQAALSCLALLVCWHYARDGLYLVWAGVFAFIVLDDALSVHELLGARLDLYLNFPALPGVRSQDTAELFVWVVAGSGFLGVGTLAFRAGSKRSRYDSVLLCGILSLLACFAVVFDILHVMLAEALPWSNLAFATIEDGGEMLALWLACAATLAMALDLRARHRAIIA